MDLSIYLCTLYILSVTYLANVNCKICFAELGASLFEIAKSLFALEQTFILGAMALNKNKSKERRANWQNTNSEWLAHEQYKDKRAQ